MAKFVKPIKITTVGEFQDFVKGVESQEGYQRPRAFGVGLARRSSAGNMLDTSFLLPNYEQNYGFAAVLASVLGYRNGNCTFGDISVGKLNQILTYFDWTAGDGKKHPNVEALRRIRTALMRQTGSVSHLARECLVTFIPPVREDEGPVTVSDAYLRLHLMSHRLVRPHGISLKGIMDTLPNNAWTSEGPIAEEDLYDREERALGTLQPLKIYSRDKIPAMLDYVVPSGVRIADGSRVRLGAFLGEGTVVMHEGFVNFNAGCAGPNMIEGRVSSGVFLKEGTDLGGGASIMGTMSGGGKEVVSVGANCLIGANAGIGISLGDFCTIEAGLYLTAGMLVTLEDNSVVKAQSLSGQDEMLFIRDSRCGTVRMLRRKNKTKLNPELHKN